MARTKQIKKEKVKFIPKEYTDDDGVDWIERSPGSYVKKNHNIEEIKNELQIDCIKDINKIIKLNTMNIYAKHDAPGGIQDIKIFERLTNENKTRISWGYKEQSVIDNLRSNNLLFNNGKWNENANYTDIKNTIQGSYDNISEEHLKKNHLMQFWREISIPSNSLIYIRGKTGKLNEGYIVKTLDTNIIIENNEMFRKVKIISKVSEEVYKNIYHKRSSIWILKKNEEINLIKDIYKSSELKRLKELEEDEIKQIKIKYESLREEI